MKQLGAVLKRYDIWIVIALFLAAIAIERHEWFSALEDQSVSFRHLLRGDANFPDNIFFVNTDEAFFEAYESFPLRRTDIGRIVKNIADLDAKVIAVDLLFDFPSSYGEDPETAALLAAAGNVVVVSQGVIEHGRLVEINPPIDSIKAVAETGYSNIQSNSAVIESMSRLRIYSGGVELNEWPFVVEVLAQYLDARPALEDGVLKFGDVLTVPLDRNQDLFIDYKLMRAGSRTYSEDHGVSALDLLDLSELDEDELAELRYQIAGNIVLIGDTSEVSHDYFDTPIGSVYGVEIIGAAINTLQEGGPLQPTSDTMEAAIAILVALALIATAYIVNPLPRLGSEVLILVVWLGLAIWLYMRGSVLSMSYVLVAGALGVLIVNLRYYLQERGQKALIHDAFGQYLSPKVVNILVKDPSKLSLGGERRVMTAFFSDLASFSTISEQLSPDELVALLNEYLTSVCEIIAGYDGTVDKFEGDAVIAFWGAPLDQEEHARLCCYAAIDQKRHMVKFREQLAGQGRPILNVRMGINTGEMLVGNLGSRQRMDYTMMGDAVNLAARLEGANKAYGSEIMISEHTYKHVADIVEVRELDRIRVVGKREAVTVYELLERRGQLSPELAELVRTYLRGLELYRERNFEDALKQFEAALAMDPRDGPSLTYKARCRAFIETPPAEHWDGVFDLETK